GLLMQHEVLGTKVPGEHGGRANDGADCEREGVGGHRGAIRADGPLSGEQMGPITPWATEWIALSEMPSPVPIGIESSTFVEASCLHPGRVCSVRRVWTF